MLFLHSNMRWSVLLVLLFVVDNLAVGINSVFDDDDDYDEPRIFNYNQYLAKPYSTKVDSKSKVETLGRVLKGHINDLKSTANKEIDLIFVVDSSTSVGKNNFKEEIKFVKKLLSDFTVDVNHTRVAVITFSSRGRVIRHIDYFAEKNNDRHKCALLEEDLKQISYSGGGTYTLGALLEASKVLKNARETASKAIFLVTDGFSNGGDPRPEAKALRKSGVRIFTFGIQNGNVRELFDMASNPKNESTYILDSFEEFEALAKRALHEDLSSGRYIEQPEKKCDRLCVGKGCCDVVATCNCGTHTGQYECMCPAGYYGNGLRTGGCLACPSGTYKADKRTGDVHTCSKCPDENHVTEPGATSPHQCVCRKGYRNFNGNGCAVLKCPVLSVPKDGYFVNDKCKNVFNAACGLRCKPGYELRGSSLRICREDGTWSGTPTQCIMKTCPALMIPKNGNMICTTDDFSFNTVCRFTCDTGYKLVGSRKRTCLAIAFWTGINTRCREITCRPLPVVRDGSIYPPACTAGDVAFGTTCSVKCHAGYSLIGPHSKQCLPEGVWTPASDVSRCVDKSPPFIMCPYNIEAETDLNENTATITWLVPLAVDNSGYVPILSSIPAVMPPEKFPIGKTKVTYIAEDLDKNRADCHFYIIVKDKQPPTIDRCFSPLPIVSPEPYAEVNWEEPMFSDNSGNDVRLRRSHAPGLFPKGKTEVVYTAYDDSGNSRTCVLKINIIPHPCEYPPSPLNGNRTCYEDSEGVVCQFGCKEGYEFAIKPANEYRCAFDNVWEPKDQMPVSDCSALQKAHDIIQPASFTFAGLVACTRRLQLTRLEKDFEHKVIKRVNQLCEEGVDCSIRDLETTCEQQDGSGVRIVLGREKRSIGALLRQRRQARSNTTNDALITFDYVIAGKTKGGFDTPEDILDQSKLMKIVENIKTSLEKDAKKGNFNLQVDGNDLALQDIAFDDTPSFVCEQGSIVVNNACVKCPVGTFFNVVSEQCESCPKGTFQPVPGQVSCFYCPSNTSTPGLHATSESNCKALCLPGSFSYNGLEMCETCRRGYYQVEYGQTDCNKCPRRYTTTRRGMRTEQDCKEKCPEGYISKSGLQPCWPCPKGSYQPKGGKSTCTKCPLGSDTSERGSTSLSDCEFELSDGFPQLVDYDYDDQQAVVGIDGCISEPCLNGATCKPLPPFGHDCICARGYSGVFCQNRVSECNGQPCLNGGTCTDLLDDFKCDCPTGYTGKKCETDINDCVGSPCQNQGTCKDAVDGFSCICDNGFEGEFCEVNINECASQPCMNGGTCADEIAGYTCKCQDGIKGEQCEINDDNCASGPCFNDAQCMDDMGTFKCICPKGYEGQQCDIDIDDCASNPCAHGAKCEDLPGGYTCHCPTGTTGPECKTEIDIYFQLDFPSTASTTDYARVNVGEDLSSATACFWMKTSDEKNQGTPFSYANKDGDNIFTLTDYDGFVIYVNGEKKTTTIQANEGSWNHMCVLWSSNRGSWKLYKNGVPEDSGRGLASGQTIKGGGQFVIGQEQDTLGGGFNSAETFIGQLTQLNLWNRELSLKEIDSLRQNCTQQMGNVIAWSDISGKPQGAVTDSPIEFCKECPVPADIDYGKAIYSGLTAGSKVSYSCNRGFRAAGRLDRLCLVTGEWAGKEPTCARVRCDIPDNVQNGWIDGDRYTFDNRIRYNCQIGFKLVGSPTRYCGEFGFWEEEAPVCEQIKCTVPLLSTNTRLTNPTPDNKFSPGDDAFFECTPGNNFYTSHTSVFCQRDGTWDLSIPTCDPQTCKPPPNIPLGNFLNPSQLTEFAVAYVAQYECNFGYHFSVNGLNPQGQIACLPSGGWETNLPECVIVTCSEPSPIAHGDYESTGTSFLDQVRYTCHTGYTPSHTDILECYEKGEWNPSPPDCFPVQCGRPEDVLHGRFDGETFSYKAAVTYVCDLGYIIVGTAHRECLENSSWSGSVPACKPRSCGRPDAPEHGSYIGRDFTLNNEIRYVCDYGYELIGSETSVCRETGKWQNGSPKCQKVECGIPQSITNGHYEGSSFFFDDTVTYKCENGYSLDGDATLTCLGTKEWSDSPPQCESIKCPSPVFVDNAHFDNPLGLELFDIGARIRYVCNTGYQISLNSLNPLGEIECLQTGQWEANLPECLLVTCQQPLPTQNGNTVLSSITLDYNSFVKYICNPGYSLVGNEFLRCESDGTWSDEPPVCQAIECAVPTQMLHGRFDYKDLNLDSVVQYSCNDGYELVGPQIRRCLANLTWSGKDPICDPIDCGDPGVIAHGQVHFEDTLFQATASYDCDLGYIIEGDTSRECNKDRQWSGDAPVCKITLCDKPSDIISNGRMIGDVYSYGAEIRYECDKGYVLIDGFDTRRCLASGQWDRPIPSCIAVECPRLDVVNGFVSGFQTEFGTEHTITCRNGYRLEGASTHTCQADGTWSGEETRCVKFQCPRLQPPNNGRVLVRGITALYTCLPGYTLNGPVRRECQSTDQWTLTDPTCDAGTCPDITNIGFENGKMTSDGLTFGSTVLFECNAGFLLQGDRTIECQQDKSWSGEIPLCKKKVCFPPFAMSNSKIIGDELSFGDTIRYECDEGFKNVGGNLERTCLADGSWSGDPLNCGLIICPVPEPNLNVRVTGFIYTYGSQLEYKCNDGYILNGPSVRTCTQNETWSGPEPVCTRNECPRPGRFENGRTQPTGFGQGSSLTYMCNEGYELIGFNIRLCLSSLQWSGTEPSCQKVKCKSPPPLANGSFKGNEFFYGDIVTYTCDEGYDLVGVARIRCLSAGEWGGADTSCIRKSCGPPPLPKNAKYSLPDGETEGTFEAEAVLSCAEGFVGKGVNVQRCEASGRWSESSFECEIVKCPEFTNIANGVLFGSGNEFGNTIEIICDEGYYMAGKSTIKCLANGQWDYDVEPVCTERGCPELAPLSNGLIDSKATNVGSVVIQSCNDGYKLHGSGRRICEKGGYWSGSDPYCTLITCQQPPNVKNALPFNTLTRYLHNSKARYTCEVGYKITTGNATLTCSDTEEWTGTVPTCSLVECGEPVQIPNSKVAVASYKYQGEAQYLCYLGYGIKGEATIRCDEFGNWVGELPSCEVIDCGKPPHVSNADIIGSDRTTFNSTITYDCQLGFNLVGQASRTCNARGVWSGSSPICEPMACGPPPEIPNAYYVGNDHFYRSTISYICVEGYEMSGTDTLECAYDGAWLGARPTCDLQTCDPPPVLPHSSTTITNNAAIGSVLTYLCNDGFYLLGAATARCNKDKQWEYEGEAPGCQRKDCGPPPAIKFAQETYTDTTYESTVSYLCDEGYTLSGSADMKCGTNGVWDGKLPTCEPGYCGAPPRGRGAKNTIITGNNYYYGGVVEYSCDTGYHLTGVSTLECTKSGKWSHDAPNCDKVSCLPLVLPKFGLTLDDNLETQHFYGDRIVLGCKEGYELRGETEIECLASGLWSSSPPECLPALGALICAPDSGIPHTRPLDDAAPVDWTEDLQCAVGYTAHGDMSATCRADGTWSTPSGQCSRVFCGKPRLRDFVNVVRIQGASYFYGDKINFRCRAGVAPARSPPVIKCLSNGNWDGDIACGVTCKRPCQNGGICLGLNRCKCPTGYGGLVCEKAICILPCLNGGSCSAPYQCSCPVGYEGVRCQKAICEKTCQHGGKCNKPNRCRCPYSYTGAFCENKKF